MPIESLFAFLSASVVLGLAPGPDNLFVLSQSALYGRKAGVLVTVGLCTGLVVHTAAVTLGVAALFQASELAFVVLKFVGATYLLYLAWQAFSVTESKLETDQANRVSGGTLYRRGIIMNVTNPKVTIFFLAFLPQFTVPGEAPVAFQMFILGVLFMLVTLIVFGGIALLGGTLVTWLNRTPKAQIYLNRIAGAVFLGLAIKLATVNVGGGVL